MPGELLTRATIWLALWAYALSVSTMLLSRQRPEWVKKARWTWTIGCAFYLAHVACAFGYYHRWSHAAAWSETARQTAAVAGFSWGGGLLFNYLFTLLWLADVLWWWLAPERFARRSTRLTAVWHGFFFFMVVNGTVIFGRGPVRWFGAVICIWLAWLWWQKPARA